MCLGVYTGTLKVCAGVFTLGHLRYVPGCLHWDISPERSFHITTIKMFMGLILCWRSLLPHTSGCERLITVLHRDAKHLGEGRGDHSSRPDV